MPVFAVSEFISSSLSPDLFDATPKQPDSGDSGGRSRPRARDRAAQWQAETARAYGYAASRIRDPQALAMLDKAFAEAMEAGPDFTRYRRGSDFASPPKISMDRNALVRLRFKLHAIFKGSWAVKEKGKHCGVIQRTTLAVFDALLGLALKHGQVFPSLVGLAVIAKVSKNTVIAALKELQEFGFVTVHRRLKRVKTALGFKTVQDTNAYSLSEPSGWGAMALKLLGGALFNGDASESNKWTARATNSHSTREHGANLPPKGPPDNPWGNLREAWEAF
jgi:hypothetical protein